MAWPMPIHTEPCTWPSTVRRLSALPQSCATHTLSLAATPASSSTLTSPASPPLRGVAVAHGAADGGAAIFLAAVRLRNGRVVARHRDGAGVLKRLGHHLDEGQALVLRAGAIKLTQAFDLLGLGLELARG